MNNKKRLILVVCVVAVLVVAGIVIFGLLGGQGNPNPTNPTTTIPTTQCTHPSIPTSQGSQPGQTSNPTDPEGTTIPTEPVDPTVPTDPVASTGPTNPTNPTDPVHTHSYTDEVTFPTCTDKGYTVHTCACGERYTDNETEAKGHDYETKTQEATCEKDGYTKQVCKTCDEETSESTTKAKGHKYGDWTTETEATCTTDGKETRTCSVCGKKDTDTLGAYGHEFDDAVVIAATCTADGYRQGTCVTCGETVKETIPATGHDWTDWEITKEVMGNEDGERQRTCKSCGKVETEVIDADHKAHTWATRVVQPEGCVGNGYEQDYCTVCGYEGRKNYKSYLAAPGHDLTDWNTTKEPGPGVSGEEERHCRNCDYEETRPIDPTDYESYIDPRIEIREPLVPGDRPTYRYGKRGGEVGRMSIIDARTWGEAPSIWVNDDNSLTVVWYNKEGERVEVHMDPPPDPDTSYRSLTIKEDGTYHMVLNYYFS